MICGVKVDMSRELADLVRQEKFHCLVKDEAKFIIGTSVPFANHAQIIVVTISLENVNLGWAFSTVAQHLHLISDWMD